MTVLVNAPKLYRTVKMLIGLALVYGLCMAMLAPFTTSGAGLGPISVSWAGPNCDADGDGFEKNHRKCNGGDDDDSDPCFPDDSVLACTSGGGGGGGGDLGSAISMDCVLEASWGESTADTIKGDGHLRGYPDLGTSVYSDAVDKVSCSIGGPSTPWPIFLGMGIKGRPENSVRKVDVDLGATEWGSYPNPGLPMSHYLPEDLFRPAVEDSADAGWPDMDDMEPIRINIRPYRNDPAQTELGIHLMDWSSEPYQMGMNFKIPGNARTNFSIASQHYPGNESFTGISCETGTEAAILTGAPGGGMKDVSVYLWRDGDDADDLPDGYTVTTGTINLVPDAFGVYAEGAPPVTAGTRYAAVCSSVGPEVCGNPKAPSNCNFLGYVKVQFTMHAVVK